VIVIGEDGRTPTRLGLEANAHALARYAALCQEAEIVPVVEPEVLMDGGHSIERCFEVTEAALHSVFHALWEQKVALEGLLLKPNMVLPGTTSARPAPVEEVAEATVRCLLRNVPAAVPGIVFLSGGQADELATAHLNAMNRLPGPRPWPLSFSYARALQAAPLRTWAGDPARTGDAQRAFRHRARCNSAARSGAYTPELERSVA
jgi:fructose-bisphosphate aldolase class I